MAPTYTTTSHGLRWLPGSNLASDIDSGFQSLAEDVDLALGAAAGGAVQEGVRDAGSFEVTQASGGASMSLDVASNVGTGAYVQDDSTARQALYYVAPTGSKTTVTATTAHATLPRVDAVVVSLAGVVSVVAGTATSGATLDNARDGSHGGAVIPSSALHLADVLIPATDTTLSNNQIRDRRKWARGALATASKSADATSTNGGALVAVDTATLGLRLECSGVPVRLTFSGRADTPTNDRTVKVGFLIDGVAPNFQWIDTYLSTDAAVGEAKAFHASFLYTGITAGSHVLEPAFAGDGTVATRLRASSTAPAIFTVEEVVRQVTKNNINTSG